MDNISHSRKPNRCSSQATLTKRTTSCNGATNFSGRTMYDDVFGGPPRFGTGVPTLSPRPEDYTEIFGGFHASRGLSIPVLDLPLVDDNDEVMFDVRNPRFNYADVFGGYDGLDLAASYEELMRQANGGDHHARDGDSSEEAWMQAETESLSEGSDHSGKYHYFSNGDYYEPIDSSMEFDISYHRANLRSNGDMSNGFTHVSQPSANPEYACIIETPLQKTEKKSPPLVLIDDIDLEFTGGVAKKKHLRKTVSHPSNWTAGEQAFTNDSTRREYQRNGSCSDEMFVTISEINLRTLPSDVPPPSRPPPLVDVKNGDFQNGQQAVSGERRGHSSPTFFDVEIDSSSAAVASAAAMKDAMDKAQAKLKSAKELLERKESMKNSMKPRSKSDGQGKKERSSKAVNRSSDIKDERVQGMYGKEDSGMKISVTEDSQKAVKTKAFDSLEGEKLFRVPKFVVEKHGKESRLIQEFDTIDGADDWQEATEFFELVRAEKSRTGFEQTNDEKYLVQSMKSLEPQENAKKASVGALEPQLDNDKKIEPAREDHELEKVQRDMKTAKENWERREFSKLSKPVKEARRQKGHDKKTKTAQEVIKLEENVQYITRRKILENGKKPTGADELGKQEKRVNDLQIKNQVEVGQDLERKENKRQEKETSEIIENPERVDKCQEREGEETSSREVFEQEKNDTKLEQILVQAENEKRLREVLEQEEKEKRLKEAHEQEENEKKEKEARELEESEKIWRMAIEQLESDKRLKQACLPEENERRQRKAFEQEEMEKKQREAHEKDESKRRPKLVTEQGKDERQQKEVGGEETENRLKEACEKEAIDELKETCEKEETVKRLKEAREKGKTEKMLEEVVEQKGYSKAAKRDTEDEVKQKVVEQEESEEWQGVNYVYQQTKWGENGKKLKIAERTHLLVEGCPLVSDEANKLNYGKKRQEILVGKNDLNCDEHEESEESILEEIGKMGAEFGDCGKKSEAMGKGDVDEKLNASRMDDANLEDKVNQFIKDDVSVLSHRDDGVEKAGEAGTGIRNAEKIYSVPGVDSDNDIQGLKFTHGWRERARNIKECQVPSHLAENKFMSAQAVKESVGTGRKPEAAKASVLEGKGSLQNTVQQVKISQSTERKEKNMNVSVTPKEEEAERLKRKRELEKERLRKIEEEREREREKDRMPVDRAALEARERVYTEACERAERAALERATAEARQRAMAEARDRLEKACGEAREKSSMEAKLRAECAAVERAKAEAQERAVEKAMAERAAFEARERVEWSMSEKFSTSRNNEMRTSSSSSDLQDTRFQTAGSFGGLRCLYSSAYNGVEGESALRCKARLERYRRTAERAAKALEEKNRRDLLAQKEQAERNRLAETLGADVKRWSSGKEGNLRALLSTLQYILGPESGWQPIPLTEVITSAAVKKAYRKATLCVHPDKLQQRGASIQQKYICEKVFDLLKEAWNKFNSEEL